MRESPTVRFDSYVLGVNVFVTEEQALQLGRMQQTRLTVDRRDPAELGVRGDVSRVRDQRPGQAVAIGQHEFSGVPVIQEALRSAHVL